MSAALARHVVAWRVGKKNWLLFYPWLSEAFPARDVGPRTYVGVRLCRLVICSPKPPAGGDERRADGSTR